MVANANRRMESTEQIWVLMSRCLSGEASVEEQVELQAALRQQPQLMQQYEMMTRLWNSNNQTEHAINEDSKINRILQLSTVQDSLQNDNEAFRVESLYRRRKLRKRVIKYMGIAAIIIFLPIAIFTSLKKEKVAKPTSAATEVVAQNGSRTRTILPDGSTVSLNAGSKILYDKNFNGTLREVTLFGEAFFDVVKNPNRPFIVHAGGINIRVLGTSFNVKSYPDDKKIETTLIHGLVQITNANDKRQAPIYLRPNQKFVASYFESDDNDEDENERAFNLDDKSFAIKNLDSTIKETERIETAWVYNRLEFKGDSFEELAKKMERWYNISIKFEDDAVKKLEFVGSFEKETVEGAFTALQAVASFKFTIKGHEIFIKTSK